MTTTPFAAHQPSRWSHPSRRSLPRVSLSLLGLFSMLALGGFSQPALAQQIVPTGQVGIACAYNSALPTLASGNYGLVQCDSTGHLLVSATISATATTSATAASALPTISAGANALLYESLGGSLYVQPVYGTTIGGGTQVDITHGLPVNVVAGGGGAITAASGAYAAGSLAAGAAVDGWNVTEGAKADAAWTSGSGSLVAISKAIANAVSGAIPAGSNTIGNVDILGHAGASLDATAGSPSAAVLSVQGVAGGTTLPVTPSNTSATPLYVSTAGTTGLDYSANKPTLPNIGANFAASGPYASYTLITTVPASATRNSVDIENTSGAQIAIIRDDGTAAAAAAPVNASVFALGGGSGAGAQGGAWSSQTFKGRLQIYSASSAAQVAVMVE